MQEEIKQASISKLVEMIAVGATARAMGFHSRAEENAILSVEGTLRGNRQHQHKAQQVRNRRRDRKSMEAYAEVAAKELDARLNNG